MIAVVGLGYVGITLAVGLASKGIRTYGYEIDPSKLLSLQKGILPFYEPHLDDALSDVINNKMFSPIDDLKTCVTESDIIFICVGTPTRKNGTDLSIVKKAIKNTINYIDKYKVIVIKSTVPPGTTANEITEFIESLGKKVGADVGLAVNPEFLREGNAWEDFMKPTRIVIGGYDKRSIENLEKLYSVFDCKIISTSLDTGEFIKYLSNTLLSTLISFSNELATLAEKMGSIDVVTAFESVRYDKKWIGFPPG